MELAYSPFWSGDVTVRRRASFSSNRYTHNERVIQYGLSLPLIFILSVAIGVSYTMAYLSDKGTQWIPRDLTGVNEWTSYGRTHLAQDPVVLLERLLRSTTISVDTSVGVNFVANYSRASEANPLSTVATFNKTWLDPQYILTHGFTIAGKMAGAFEGFGAWPCATYVVSHPIVSTVCPDVAKDWFTIQIYNNPVATTSEKASTYLSLSYTPMSLLSARIWTSQAPDLLDDGIIVRGLKEGTYTERIFYLLKHEQGALALAKVSPCDRTSQSNALECDHLEDDDVYVRNYAKRDFDPPDKLDRVKFYGPALAMGNFVAADKTFVMLPAIAIVMTNAGYSATTRFATTFPFRFTIRSGKLVGEWSIPQVAAYTEAVGNSFAAGAIQMALICLVVYTAIAHCRTRREVVAREGRIFRFRNHITMGLLARRLGTYKIVSIQLCVYHALNVRSYLAAVYYQTQKATDTFSFASEGVLLMVVCSMLLDQVIFFERYSSVRETLTVLTSCAMYLGHLYLNTTFFLWRQQVQVTELKVCAGANQCNIIHGVGIYYAGLCLSLVVPVLLVNGPIHWFLISTRASYPRVVVAADKLTSFEKFCVGTDARIEFGDFERDSLGTPISIVHAAGFTYVGPYLVRIKDYYMVVLARWLPEVFIKSCGLTMSLFKTKDGKVVAGRHMLLGVAYKLFRNTHADAYEPIP